MVAAKPTPEPEKPVAVAAKPTPEPTKPAVVATKPETPDAPVVRTPRPAVPRITIAATPSVTAPPTNVIVPGAPVPSPSSIVGDRILVQGYAPPPVADNYPILSSGISSVTRGAPAAVTVDEPELTPRRKGKKKRQSRIPEY